MTTGTSHARRLRTALLCGNDVPDEHLLERFLADRDESAFEAIVRRHGPMVLGVCRRVLRHSQDAEDAFQATFLVLVRRAASLGRRERLGNWLYGVAYRTALEARTLHARRRAREAQVAPPVPAEPDAASEWLPLLDRELVRLPDKYRLPVVLCELEGRPRREVARLLGLAEGTLSSRLAAARKRLAGRLSRLGVALSFGVAAAVPAELRAAAVRAALNNSAASPEVAALVKGVLQTMFLTKFKTTVAVLLALEVALCGVGVLTHQALAGKSPPAAALPARADQKPDKTEQGPTVHGVVQAVDASKGTITVSVRTDPSKKTAEDQTYTLGKDVKVTLQENLSKDQPPPEGKTSDLTPGTEVDLQLAADKKTVTAVSARGPGVNGSVKSVDASKGTLTFQSKGDKGAMEQTVTLVKGGRVLLNDGLAKNTPDQEGKLGDLTEGTPVHVQLSVDRKSALSIRPYGESLLGTLKGLDLGNRTITIEVKENGLVEKTFSLAKDARIEGNPNNGDGVRVRLSVFDKKVAVHVQAKE